jgi:photosystem II stability/assembly factor-like uncharacterized protein
MNSRISAFITLLFFLLPAMTAPLVAAWQHFPAGQPTVTSFAVTASGQRQFVLAPNELWHSGSGGEQWISLAHNLPDQSGVPTRIQAIDAAGDSLLLTDFCEQMRGGATGPSLVSYDGGNTWRQITGAAGEFRANLTVWQSQHNIWICGFMNTLRRSDDYGTTWSESAVVPFDMIAVTLVQGTLNDPALYAYLSDGTSSSNIVWRSNDLGTTWTAILNASDQIETGARAKIVDLTTLNDGGLVVLLDCANCSERNDGAWITRNRGQTWEPLTSLNNQVQNLRRIGEDRTRSGTLLALSDDPVRILRSTDSGASWQTTFTGSCEASALDLYQSPYGGSIYFLAGSAGMYCSGDHGQSWTSVALPHLSNIQYGHFAVAPEAVFYADCPNVIHEWQWETGAADWQRICRPRFGADTVYVMSPMISKLGLQLLAYTQVRVGQNYYSRLLQSADNGQTWGWGLPCPALFNIEKFNAHTENGHLRLIGTTDNWPANTVWISEDRGHSWEALPSSAYQTVAEISQTDSTIVVLAQGGQTYSQEFIARCVRPGNTLETIYSADHWRLQHLLQDGERIYITDTTDNMLRVWDQGIWFTSGPLPVPRQSNFQMIVIPGSAPRLAGIAQDASALWVSEDLGASWSARPCLLPNSAQQNGLSHLTYDSYRQRVWLSSSIGPCYADAAELAIHGQLLQLHPASFELSIFPNPFNGEARIRFALNRKQHATLDLYNVEGRLVQRLTDAVYEAGTQEIRLAVPELPSGVYFVRLAAGEMNMTEKILLLK